MRRKALKIFAALFLAVITLFTVFASSCGKPDYSVMPEAVRKVFDNTFVVNCVETNQTATGFVYTYYEGDPIAITNYHTIAKTAAPYAASETEAVFYDGKSYAAEVMGWSEYHDIALLRLDCNGEFYDFAANNAFASAENGDFVCSIGNEHGNGELIYSAGEFLKSDGAVYTDKKGRYSSSGTSYKYVPVHTISCSVEEGMSGCPIADENGNIVAVGTYREDVRLNKKYFAVPIEFAIATAEKVLENYTPMIGAGEVSLFGYGEYSAFLTSETKELAVLGNYYSWSGSTKKLASDGFTCVYDVTSKGFVVTYSGTECPLKTGDVITALDGKKFDGTVALLSELYENYECGDGAAAVFTLSDGREVTHSGITAKID